MDIGEWLRSLDLGRYEAAFRANEIDEEILPKLTADDLSGLGVVPIGHRRKLLEAIAALRAGERPALPGAPVAAARVLRASAAESRFEALRGRDLSHGGLVGIA
jgi:hypothetical protein